VADLGGCSLRQLPAPKRLQRPLEWRLFDINSPLLGTYRSRNRDLQYSKPEILKLFQERPLWRLSLILAPNLKIKHEKQNNTVFAITLFNGKDAIIFRN